VVGVDDLAVLAEVRLTGAPKALMTARSVSAKSVKGSWYFSLKAFWASTESELTPMIATPWDVRSA